jgi:predicted metal-dependent RNase
MFVTSSLQCACRTRYPFFRGRLSQLEQRQPYISLKDLFMSEDAKEMEAARLGTMEQPVAKRINGRYVSPYSSKTEKKAWDVIKLLISSRQNRIKLKNVTETSKFITNKIVDRLKCKSTAKPHLTWIGHATCYYQTDGMFFLTDPLWSEYASPVQGLGPKRFIEPAIEIEDLKIDVVLLSHTHYDHLDMNSAKRIGNRALW